MSIGLREHLLAVASNQPSSSLSQGTSSHDPLRSGPPTSGPQDSNIDPGLGGGQYAPMDMSHGDSSSVDAAGADDRGKGKRELSTSKRAAQNRAAQVCLPLSILFVPYANLRHSEHSVSARRNILRASKTRSRI